MSNTTVKVPPASGTIVITTAGETRREYPVSSGTISVPEGQLADVLRLVPGAELAKGEDAPAAVAATPPAEQLPKASSDDLAVPAADTGGRRK